MVKDKGEEMKNSARILVVDDEKDVCDIFKKTLTQEGYDVFTAPDGESGIEIVKEKKPDIVLLDLKMPKMGGIEVLQRIKEIDKNTVVIIITGYGSMDSARMAMRLGAFDYITKPIDLNYVKAVVKDGLKMTLQAIADEMKGKEIAKSIRSVKIKLDSLKHCGEVHSCLWEVALRSFVLRDDTLMSEWIQSPVVSKEEKLGLLKIAEILKANMVKKKSERR